MGRKRGGNMGTFDYDIGIIGGGAAGLSAAAGAGQFGAKTLLVEKAETLGGDCLHYGCVPSKTLIRTAGLWSLAKRSREFGLPPIDLAPVDLEAVMNRVRSVVETIQEHDSPERFHRLGAEVRFGAPRFADDHTVVLDGTRVSARSWIVATGSTPAIPPVEGLEEVPYWTNETVFFKKELPGRLLVLGGGAIGLEMAQAFQRLGSQVTVVEFLDQILGPEDPDMADILKDRFEAEGIRLLTGRKAVKAASSGSTVFLTVAPSRGEGETVVLEGDALLVATGRKPSVNDLDLSAAGVAYTAKGVPADARMRTNVPHIYSCGDVNGILQFTHVAGYEAGIALTNAVMRLPRKADYTKVPWVTYTDPEVASVGLNEKRAKAAGIEYRVLEERFRENDRALAEGEPEGKIKVLITPGGRILGAQITGAHAGELVHEWVAAVNGRVKLSSLAGGIHAYPTLSEISKKAAGSYYSQKLFSERTRKVLRFFFGYRGMPHGVNREAA
jgi:pyruvate/2-oxoglutarate dehydrogenase complex dihydrolipoamide dehydrogenase (E3) component